jgi:hypothetical protein
MYIVHFFFARAGGIRQGVDILWTRNDLTGRRGTTRYFLWTTRYFLSRLDVTFYVFGTGRALCDGQNPGVGDNGNANHVFGWFHAAKQKLINYARNNVVGSKVITVL